MRAQLATLDRLRRIAQTLMRHGLLGLVDQIGLGDGSLVVRHLRDDLPAARFGRRLSRALNDLGPTFIKLGQFLSTREDLFPPAVARELAVLQDDAKKMPAPAVREAVASALGRRLPDAFVRFDDEPLAAGSIAQVHRARTPGGAEVVVKVRRPGIERDIEHDLVLLRALARQARDRSADIARLDPVGIVEELGTHLRLELDFAREAECLRRMREVVGSTAHVPAVFAELTAGGLLTMEWVEGVNVASVGGGDEGRRAARALLACFATQYLRGHIFHGDPHGGNLLWRPDGSRPRLALLDLGATGAIDPAMRRMLFRLSAAALRRDGERLAEVGLAMVHAPPDLDRAAYRRDLGRLLEPAVSNRLGEMRLSELVRGVFAVAQRYRVRIRSEYFALFRSTMLIDGVLRRLDPDIDPVAETRRYILRKLPSRRWFVPAVGLLVEAAAARTALLLRFRLVRPALLVGSVAAILTIAHCTGG